MANKNKLQEVDVIIPSPVGNLGFCLIEEKLATIQFLPSSKARNPALKKRLEPILAELSAYFRDPRHRFNLALQPSGTRFQKTVWKMMQEIPSGKTVTYLDLAQRLNTSPRAIGQACRQNPLPILIPCHRVVSKMGLGGFSGEKEGKFMKIKQDLLQHEAGISTHLPRLW